MKFRAACLRSVGPNELNFDSDCVLEVDAEGRVVSLRPPLVGESVDEDLRPGCVVPGFVDTHTHFAQSAIVGAATGPLLQWLETSVFPAEVRLSRPGWARRLATSFCDRVSAAGTTTVCAWGSSDPQVSEVLIEELESRGLRARVGPALMDRDAPAELCVETSQALDGLHALQERCAQGSGRVQLAVLPRFALACTPGLMRAAGDFAAKQSCLVSTHLAETRAEVEAVRARFGTEYLSVYADHGLLGAHSSFAHCLHLAASDWELMSAAGASALHCPDSNDFLGSGTFNPHAPLSAGVGIGLGSDIAAGRDYRISSQAQRAYDHALRSGLRLAWGQLLWWATAGGAQALGIERLGRLEPGEPADFGLWRFAPWVEEQDGAGPRLAALFGSAQDAQNRALWVDGRAVWRAASQR